MRDNSLNETAESSAVFYLPGNPAACYGEDVIISVTARK